MKYRVSAAVESVAQLPSDVRIKDNNDEYLFEINEDKFLVQVHIERKLDNYDEILPRFQFGLSGVHTIEFPHLQSPLHGQMIGSLQYIEALGSFFLGISRIKWQDAKWEWVPENETEREKIEVLSAHFKYEFPLEPRPVIPELIARMLVNKSRLESFMTVPMSFFQEGTNNFHDLKYAASFMNFYLYLENLYGNGKTKNVDIEREFIKSKHVSGGVNDWLNDQTGGKRGDPGHLLFLQALLEERSWPLDFRHVIKLLVRLRGEVHHSSGKDRRRQTHPLNQKQYRTVAYLTLSICIYSIVRIYDHNEEPL